MDKLLVFKAYAHYQAAEQVAALFNNSTHLYGVFLFWLSVIVATLKFIFLLLIVMQES